MTRKRPRVATAGPRSICHWQEDDDDDGDVHYPATTTNYTAAHSSQHQQQLTLNSFFVQGTKKLKVVVPSTPPPLSSSKLVGQQRPEDARTPPTVSPLMIPENNHSAMTPPTPPTPQVAVARGVVATTSATTTTLKKPKQFQQVYLDCGQSAFGQQLCQKCGMLYMPGVPEDMKAHAVICKERCLGVLWPRSNGQHQQHQRLHWRSDKKLNNKKEESSSSSSSSLILSVTIRTGTNSKQKCRSYHDTLESVYRLVAQDLGMDTSSSTMTESLAGYTVWLYLRKQRVVGFVATKPISQAFELVLEDSTTSTTATTTSSLHDEAETTTSTAHAKNKDDNDVINATSTTTSSALDHHSAALLPTTANRRIPHKAMLGVAILWTHEHFRGQGIATQLVDTARQQAFFGMVVPTRHIAFSSPTQAGWTFAQNYCGGGKQQHHGTAGPCLMYDYRPPNTSTTTQASSTTSSSWS